MISENYTIGFLSTDKKSRQKPILVFGNKPEDIEGYEEAINSDEMYVPHHKLEKDYTMKELQQMNRYDIVPANELIWLPQSVHNGNNDIHKGLRECKSGNKKGCKIILKPETIKKRFYEKYEKIVEKENNRRELKLRKLRFELVYNRTDISRQRKDVICYTILSKVERKFSNYDKLKEFEKMLKKQQKLKWQGGGVIWDNYEEKLQKMIEVL